MRFHPTPWPRSVAILFAALNIEAKQIKAQVSVQVLHGQGFVETNARFARLLTYPTRPCKACVMLRLRAVSVLLSACWRIVGMQAEEQRQAATSHEIPPQADSEESRSKRGGKRPGAGRKPNLAKRLLKGFTRDVIALAVQEVDVGAVIVGLLKSKRERARLETLVFVRDAPRSSSAERSAVWQHASRAYGLAPAGDAVR
jgi:hypothetical protein